MFSVKKKLLVNNWIDSGNIESFRRYMYTNVLMANVIPVTMKVLFIKFFEAIYFSECQFTIEIRDYIEKFFIYILRITNKLHQNEK